MPRGQRVRTLDCVLSRGGDRVTRVTLPLYPQSCPHLADGETEAAAATWPEEANVVLPGEKQRRVIEGLEPRLNLLLLGWEAGFPLYDSVSPAESPFLLCPDPGVTVFCCGPLWSWRE
jgi:hypothetical protein